MSVPEVSVENDPDHPAGGYALVRWRGRTTVPAEAPLIVETLDRSRRWVVRSPEVRGTPDGCLLCFGGSIVDEVPADTAVALVIAEIGARAEIVWPQLTPSRAPRRKRALVRTAEQRVVVQPVERGRRVIVSDSAERGPLAQSEDAGQDGHSRADTEAGGRALDGSQSAKSDDLQTENLRTEELRTEELCKEEQASNRPESIIQEQGVAEPDKDVHDVSDVGSRDRAQVQHETAQDDEVRHKEEQDETTSETPQSDIHHDTGSNGPFDTAETGKPKDDDTTDGPKGLLNRDDSIGGETQVDANKGGSSTEKRTGRWRAEWTATAVIAVSVLVLIGIAVYIGVNAGRRADPPTGATADMPTGATDKPAEAPLSEAERSPQNRAAPVDRQRAAGPLIVDGFADIICKRYADVDNLYPHEVVLPAVTVRGVFIRFDSNRRSAARVLDVYFGNSFEGSVQAIRVKDGLDRVLDLLGHPERVSINGATVQENEIGERLANYIYKRATNDEKSVYITYTINADKQVTAINLYAPSCGG